MCKIYAYALFVSSNTVNNVIFGAAPLLASTRPVSAHCTGAQWREIQALQASNQCGLLELTVEAPANKEAPLELISAQNAELPPKLLVSSVVLAEEQQAKIEVSETIILQGETVRFGTVSLVISQEKLAKIEGHSGVVSSIIPEGTSLTLNIPASFKFPSVQNGLPAKTTESRDARYARIGPTPMIVGGIYL